MSNFQVLVVSGDRSLKYIPTSTYAINPLYTVKYIIMLQDHNWT